MGLSIFTWKGTHLIQRTSVLIIVLRSCIFTAPCRIIFLSNNSHWNDSNLLWGTCSNWIKHGKGQCKELQIFGRVQSLSNKVMWENMKNKPGTSFQWLVENWRSAWKHNNHLEPNIWRKRWDKNKRKLSNWTTISKIEENCFLWEIFRLPQEFANVHFNRRTHGETGDLMTNSRDIWYFQNSVLLILAVVIHINKKLYITLSTQ